MEGMGLKFTPVVLRPSLRLSKHVWAYGLALLGLIASPNAPNEGFNLSPAAHPPPQSTPFPYMCHS